MWIFIIAASAEEMVCTGSYTLMGRGDKAPSPPFSGVLYLHVQEEKTAGNTILLSAKQSDGAAQSYCREGIPRIYSCFWQGGDFKKHEMAKINEVVHKRLIILNKLSSRVHFSITSRAILMSKNVK